VRIGALLILLGVSCTEPNENLPDSGTPDTGTDAGIDIDAGNDIDSGTNDGGSDPQELCPPGATLLQFSMTPVNPLPSVGDLDFPTLPPNPMIVSKARVTTSATKPSPRRART
jgi:hypothetical protein